MSQLWLSPIDFHTLLSVLNKRLFCSLQRWSMVNIIHIEILRHTCKEMLICVQEVGSSCFEGKDTIA